MTFINHIPESHKPAPLFVNEVSLEVLMNEDRMFFESEQGERFFTDRKTSKIFMIEVIEK